jgi:hypothetical protein
MKKYTYVSLHAVSMLHKVICAASHYHYVCATVKYGKKCSILFVNVPFKLHKEVFQVECNLS